MKNTGDRRLCHLLFIIDDWVFFILPRNQRNPRL